MSKKQNTAREMLARVYARQSKLERQFIQMRAPLYDILRTLEEIEVLLLESAPEEETPEEDDAQGLEVPGWVNGGYSHDD